MPAQASITVKKLDGTTDIIYDAIVGSGGDGQSALYRQDTGASSSLPQGLRARFYFMTKWNGPKTARVGVLEYIAPYATQDSTTTKWSSTDSVVMKCVVTMPQAIPTNTIGEFVTQGLQLFGASAVRSAMNTGYAPT